MEKEEYEELLKFVKEQKRIIIMEKSSQKVLI